MATMIRYSEGEPDDPESLRQLALKAWGQYRTQLTAENWQKLEKSLSSEHTYRELLQTSTSILALAGDEKLVGMAFLVPSGNPTEIYDAGWSYIRFVSVDPNFAGQGIGRELTRKCLELAHEKGEKTIALHTSEMMHRARHIYESLGFRVHKTLAPRFGKQYWLYTMQLKD